MSEGARTTVRLEADGAELDDPRAVAGQLPPPESLAPGSVLVVEPVATRRAGRLAWLAGRRRARVTVAARCTALLARGYVDVAASGGAVWGRAP